MITLAIPKENISTDRTFMRSFWLWLLRRFARATVVMSNFTLERGESIIIHSEDGADKTVAVKCMADGRLRVLFSPPSVDKDFMDVIDDRTVEMNVDMQKIKIGA